MTVVVLKAIGRLVLWLLGVAIGVAVLLAAVMGASYAFTGEGSCPAPAAQFGQAELEPNGYCWQVPLVGGVLDRVFYSPSTLTVQKLGLLYEARPALTLPEWATYAQITVSDAAGNVLFEGSAGEYDSFLYPSNGEYKADLTIWRIPGDMTVVAFEGGGNGAVRLNPGLEKPAKPIGYYSYAFRFTLQASAEVELSAERVEQGGIVGMRISGMVGSEPPVVTTDLGSVQCTRSPDGWRCYIPAAYNASSGAHAVEVLVGGETLSYTLTVTPRDFGEAIAEPEPEATEAANAEFRNTVWPIYEQTARDKMWSGGWLCPLEDYVILVDFGQVKVVSGERGSRSNSTLLYAIPGEPVRAPAAGVVVLAQNLALTGNTVVIDHGCGMRSYLYGLASLDVKAGQTVERGQALGPVGEQLTMDFKLGSKSVNPWLLFQTSGGLFWREKD